MTSCETCGGAIADDEPAARAFRRLVENPSDAVPDRRGAESLFHEACAPDWGDPAWISRSEGPASELTAGGDR